MKLKITSLILLFLCINSNANAGATFIPRAGLSTTNYTLEFPNFPGGFAPAESDFLSLRVGGTIAMDTGYFVDFDYASSLDASIYYFNFDDEFTRTEFAITLGLPLSEQLTVFGGFKNAGSFINISSGTEDTFIVNGFFAGGAYTVPLNEDSALSFNLAGALLNGTFDNGNLASEADATFGFSIGVAYKYFISNSMGLSLSLSNQSFNYTGWSSSDANLDNALENMNESITNFSANIFIIM